VSVDAIQYIIREAGVAAGLGDAIHPHMLRHGAGYALINDGVDVRLVQAARRYRRRGWRVSGCGRMASHAINAFEGGQYMSGTEKPHELRSMVVDLQKRVAKLEAELTRLIEENKVLREQASKR
jgi:hypothetical protein